MNEFLVPPNDVEIEELVIGAILLEPHAFEEVTFIHSDIFYDFRHRVIFDAIKALRAEFTPVDLATVWKHLQTKQLTEQAGGIQFYSKITNRIGSSGNIEYHAKILYQLWIQRELILTWAALGKKAYKSDIDVFDLLHESGEVIFKLQDSLHGNKRASTMKSLIESERNRYAAIQIANREGRAIGTETGFTDLNHLTKGWQPSDLIILAARPAMGKTAMILSYARAAAGIGTPVSVFSLEMSELQLTQRLVIMESEIDPNRYKTATLGNGEVDHLEVYRKHLESLPIHIDDTPALSVIDLRAKARRMKQQHGIGLIIIDYIQLMTTGRKERGNREQEISFISRMLKVIAKELDVPVIALSQLSRQCEQRPDKRPQLSDLRESGAIEQDADMVIFVHRPEYYGLESDSEHNAELIIAKHRNGETGRVFLDWKSHLTKFIDPKKNQNAKSGIQPNRNFYESEKEDQPF